MTYYRRSKGNKYGSKKVVIDGQIFDSKKEVHRWNELRLLERAGQIHSLQRQVKFELIPNQYEPTGELYTKGEKKGQSKQRLAERSCSYVADFVYFDSDDRQIVEDVKGYKNNNAYALFVIKRKLMLYVYGIRIKEI